MVDYETPEDIESWREEAIVKLVSLQATEVDVTEGCIIVML